MDKQIKKVKIGEVEVELELSIGSEIFSAQLKVPAFMGIMISSAISTSRVSLEDAEAKLKDAIMRAVILKKDIVEDQVVVIVW